MTNIHILAKGIKEISNKNESKIFIGLQNNFKEYQNTRHNAGAIVLLEVMREIEKKNECKSGISGNSKKHKFYFSPGYMNLSGDIIAKVKKENNLKLREEYKNIFVFCDDVNIPVGEFKISFGEGASSQNGIKNITEKLGSKNFYRVRIGIGKKMETKDGKTINWRPDPNGMSDYVLSNFSQTEITIIKNLALNVLENIN
jgi:PTH1 family peptidyl-tRNA hydrolase